MGQAAQRGILNNLEHYLVIVNNSLSNSLVQHLLVPLLQTFGFGDLLIRWMTVEDVVVSFAGRTRPDVSCGEPQLLDVFQVPDEDLMVHTCPQMTRLEKVHAVQVGDVHTPARDEDDEQMEREIGVSKHVSSKSINMLKAQFPGNSITWTRTRAEFFF